jgi:transcriptional regulator PpsR
LSASLAGGADIALRLDADGIIRDVALGPDAPPIPEWRAWVGRRWADTVTDESRAAVGALMQQAGARAAGRRRVVQHVTAGRATLPVAYTTVRLRRPPQIVAFGRDVRELAAARRQAADAQLALERERASALRLETRLGLLLELAREPVLVVEGDGLTVTSANAAAAELLDLPSHRLLGRSLPAFAERAHDRALAELFAGARVSGGPAEACIRLKRPDIACTLIACAATEGPGRVFLVKICAAGANGPDARGDRSAPGPDALLEAAPDPVVVTDPDGRLTWANRAFLELAQLASVEQARGRPLARWLGRAGAEAGALLSHLREHGRVRLFATALCGEYGSTTEVEVSAGTLTGRAGYCISIRDVGRRLDAGPRDARDLTLAVEQLTGLVGRVSLRDLLRDTSDLVERHFIAAALELSGGNRTAAARVLGLSRQSLYVKLQHHHLGAPAGEP